MSEYVASITSMDAPKVHDSKTRRAVFYVSLEGYRPDDIPVNTKPAPATDYETWRGEMGRVHDEMDRVKALNAPTVARNREISKENLGKPLGFGDSMLPLPFKPDDWIRPLVLREEHYSAKLTAKTPAEWRSAVDTIEDIVLRKSVARIVWWDFFGHRPATNRWGHLDKYLEGEYVRIDKEILKRGLYQAGYSPWHAHRRLNAAFDYSRESVNGKDHGRHLLRKKIEVKRLFHNCKKVAVK